MFHCFTLIVAKAKVTLRYDFLKTQPFNNFYIFGNNEKMLQVAEIPTYL